tara:strand:- start:4044 stop:4736 length:693 start_codon:yes stop_codon:yes gene_type:complete
VSFLVANLPLEPVFVRKEFLYNNKKGHGEFIRGYWVSVKAQKHRALLFETLLEDGSLYDKLPIEAFVHKTDASVKYKQSDLALWDMDGWHITTIVKDSLRHLDARVRIGNDLVGGTYVCTVDQADADGQLLTTCASIPKEHKSQNVIALDNGQYCSMPNNRILWVEQSLTKVVGPPDWEACDEIYFSNTLRNYRDDEKWWYEGDGKEEGGAQGEEAHRKEEDAKQEEGTA